MRATNHDRSCNTRDEGGSIHAPLHGTAGKRAGQRMTAHAPSGGTPKDWDADIYHRVSDPQLTWGLELLESVPLRAGETVIDAGCGSGRVTAALLARLSDIRVIAVDVSPSMIQAARTTLGAHATRAACVQADATALPFSSAAEVVFSSATFHWIRDHPALFASIRGALKVGGHLAAQYGGGPNLRRFRERCAQLVGQPPFAAVFADWAEPWRFSTPEETAALLRQGGFVDIHCDLFPRPVIHPDAGRYRQFIEHVICGPYLERLPDSDLRERFLWTLTTTAASDDPPFALDYWRLNVFARKPAHARP
jgi:trans-aconitate 2-methyltransferase